MQIQLRAGYYKLTFIGKDVKEIGSIRNNPDKYLRARDLNLYTGHRSGFMVSVAREKIRRAQVTTDLQGTVD